MSIAVILIEMSKDYENSIRKFISVRRERYGTENRLKRYLLINGT